MDFKEIIKNKILLNPTDGIDGMGAGAVGSTTIDSSGGEIEIPEYIKSYTDTIEDSEQKEFLSGLLKEEKGVNLLKNLIHDPNAEFKTKAEEFGAINKEEVDDFLINAKSLGIPEEYARKALEGRNSYLTAEREKMTPELRTLDENINNFLLSASADERDVYARLAENATGRKILVEKIMGGKPDTSLAGAGAGADGKYTESSFIDKYNQALDNKDTRLMEELKSFARQQETINPFYMDFLGRR